MRPRTIEWFQWLMVAGLTVSILDTYRNWSKFLELANTQLVVLIASLSVILNVVLMLGVSRWRSRVAKWVFVGLFAIVAANLLLQLGRGIDPEMGSVQYSSFAIRAVAAGLLFTRSARAWMANPGST